jgi:hypothetical protein
MSDDSDFSGDLDDLDVALGAEPKKPQQERIIRVGSPEDRDLQAKIDADIAKGRRTPRNPVGLTPERPRDPRFARRIARQDPGGNIDLRTPDPQEQHEQLGADSSETHHVLPSIAKIQPDATGVGMPDPRAVPLQAKLDSLDRAHADARAALQEQLDATAGGTAGTGHMSPLDVIGEATFGNPDARTLFRTERQAGDTRHELDDASKRQSKFGKGAK